MIDKSKKHLFYLCLILFSFPVNALEEVKYCLALHSEKCSVAVSRYEKDFDYELGSKENVIPRGISELLLKYYEAAKANNLTEIVGLYSVEDGSKSKMEENVRKNPSMYSKFNTVGRVEIYRLVRMADYLMVGVRWYDKKQSLLGSWTELVNCQGQCKMSSLLLSDSSIINFFNIVVLGNSLIEELPVGEVVTYPEDGKYKASFVFKPEYYETGKTFPSGNIESLSKLINTLKANYPKLVVGKDANQVLDSLLSLYSSYWPNITSSTYFSIPNKGQVGNSGSNILVFSSMISRVKKVIPLFSVKGNDVDFIFVNFQFSDEDSRLFMFMVDQYGMLISQAELSSQDASIAQAFQSKYINKFIYERFIHLSHHVDVVDGDENKYLLETKEKFNGTVEPELKVIAKGADYKYILLFISVVVLMFFSRRKVIYRLFIRIKKYLS